MATTPDSGAANESSENRDLNRDLDRDPLHAFAELARMEVNRGSAEDMLRGIAELAKRSLGQVEDVSLTVIVDGHPRTVVFTGPLAVDLDERQYELGYGPCLDAAKSGQSIVVDTDDEHSSYREFGRTAARAGIHHTVSVGLPLAQRSIGGLNIYIAATNTATAISSDFVARAEVFAAYAAVAVNNITSFAAASHEAEHLRIAIESRAVIEQAKGVLIARDRCTPEEAFELLTRISQNRNIKLQQLARTIVEAAQK